MLTLWSPALAAVEAELDRLAERDAEGGGLCPAADVIETEAAFRVSLDLPGHDPAAIEVRVEKDVLTIRSERKLVVPAEEETVHRSERPCGAAVRSFALPRTVDASKVEARCENGVLTVTLPKRDEAKPRQIPVQVSSV